MILEGWLRCRMSDSGRMHGQVVSPVGFTLPSFRIRLICNKCYYIRLICTKAVHIFDLFVPSVIHSYLWKSISWSDRGVVDGFLEGYMGRC